MSDAPLIIHISTGGRVGQSYLGAEEARNMPGLWESAQLTAATKGTHISKQDSYIVPYVVGADECVG